jgi:hypothetical protein
LLPCGLGLLAYAAWDYERVSQIYLEPEERRAYGAKTHPGGSASPGCSGQARFAELTLTTLTRDNLPWVDLQTARPMLHYSPEPRVIEKVIESATMAGRYDEAVLHLARYRAAFPEDYAKWRAAQKVPLPVHCLP